MRRPRGIRRRVGLWCLTAVTAGRVLWPLGALVAAIPPTVQFELPAMFDTGEAQPAELEQADFNGDGLKDLAVLTTLGGGRVHFLIANGAGQLLKDNTLLAPYATGIGSGDFNRDGIRDLAVTQSANKTAADGFCGITPGTMIFLGTGGATPGFAFTTCLAGFGAGHHLTDAATGDFDGDGQLDVAVADDAFYSLRVYRGVGDGTFRLPIRATNASGIRVFGPLTTLDVNHDGYLDLIASTAGGIGTFMGNGTGVLRFTSTAVGGAGLFQHMGILSFGIGDLNHDGHADIVGVERASLPATPTIAQSFVFAALGTGNGVTYATTATLAFPSATAGAVLFAEFNKDAAADVAIADRAGNAVRLLLGNGDGTLTEQAPVAVGLDPMLLAAADWTSDNWTDLAVVDRNNGNQSRTWLLAQIPGVGDDISPTVSVTAPADASVLLGTVTVSATAADASGIGSVDFYAGAILIGSDTTDPFSISWDTTGAPNGAQVLTARATDTFGNSGASAGVAVTLNNPDTTAPSVALTAPAPSSTLSGVVALSAGATDFNGVARVEFYRSGVLLGTDSTPPGPFTLAWSTPGVPPGSYVLTARAFDAAGNSSDSAPVPVTVNQPPTANAGLPQTIEATSSAGARVTVTGTGTDPDAGDTLAFAWRADNVAVGATATVTLTLPPGIHALVLRVTDALGAYDEEAVGITIDDTTPPTLALPANMTREATSASGAPVTFSATATDIVSGSVPVTCAPASGSTFALGATTVTCSAKDAYDNIGSGSFTITVGDTTPPVVNVPANLTIPATSAAGAIATFTASASDLVSGSRPVTCTPASGTTFPIGLTTVTCTADDAAGRRGTASFTVTVRDNAPVLNLPANLTLEAASAAGAVATFTASATDVIDGSVAVTCAPASGSTFPLGATTVSCTAQDSAGQTSSGSFTVTVRDTAAPALNLPANLSLEATSAAGAIATYTASATDAVDGSVAVTCAPASGSAFPLGATIVSCTAQDSAGQTSSGSFTVAVGDTTPPAVSVPANLTLEATSAAGAVAAFTVSATDLVSGSLLVTCTSASGTTFLIGLTTVTCTADDAAGLRGSASFTVTVVDTTPPALTPPWNRNLEITSGNGAVATFTPTAIDLVDGAIVSVCAPASGSTFPLGTTTVTCTATDTHSNRVTFSFTVTVTLVVQPLTSVTITADVTAPQKPNTPITFTASATGGVAPHEFKWWVYDGTAWTSPKNWSTDTTFTWTPTTVNANYVVYVWARSAGNAADGPVKMAGRSFPILSTLLTGVTLTADRTAPQVPGTPITFTAAATGGVGPHQFKWWLYDGTTWTIAQDWSTSANFPWTPMTANANYLVYVWARSAGNTADTSERMAGRSFPILSGFITGVTLTADHTAPQSRGTGVTFTAAATGGVGPHQFKWWLYDGTAWTIAQDWSTAANFTWTPTTENANYLVYVWARSAGNTADASERMAGRSFPILSSFVTGVTLTADQTAPVASSTTVTFTAAATGGVGPHQFKWWVYDGTAWTIGQNWSTAPSFAWTPATANGNYLVYVWARSAGNTADTSEKMAGQPFSILSSFVTGVASTADHAAPLTVLE